MAARCPAQGGTPSGSIRSRVASPERNLPAGSTPALTIGPTEVSSLAARFYDGSASIRLRCKCPDGDPYCYAPRPQSQAFLGLFLRRSRRDGRTASWWTDQRHVGSSVVLSALGRSVPGNSPQTARVGRRRCRWSTGSLVQRPGSALGRPETSPSGHAGRLRPLLAKRPQRPRRPTTALGSDTETGGYRSRRSGAESDWSPDY